MKRLIMLSTIAAALLTTGLLAALSLAPTASAWDTGNLPPGFSTRHTIDAAPGSPCPESYTILGGGAVSQALCTNSPTYQADFDAFVNAHYTPPPSTTAPTTQPGATTTVVVTTTTPATTTAAPPDASTPAPPGQPEPPPTQATTTVVTVVTTATPLEQALQAQIDELAAKIAALTDRVSRVEKAGDAAWLAFQQAVLGGADPAAAAETARGTWLNAIYGLGDFAP